MAFRLSIEDGPYVQTLHVASDRLMVGRAPSNQLRLTADGVAKRHAMLRQDGQMLVFTDLHSASGLDVDGRRHERVEARPGDTVGLGSARITVLEVTAVAVKEAPPAPAPRPVTAPARTPEPLDETGGLEFEPLATENRDPPAEAPEERRKRSPGAPIRLSADTLAAMATHTRRAALTHEEEFADLAYRALGQTPWWLLSIAAHALLLFVLTLTPFSTTPTYQPVDAALAVAEPQPEGLDDQVENPLEEPDPFDDMDRPDLDPLEPEPEFVQRPELEEEDPLAPEDENAFAAPEADDLPETGASVLGLDASAIASGDMGATFGKDGAAGANRAAAHAIGNNPFSRALLRGLRSRTDEHKIRVVKGQYDKCEKVFAALGLDHGWITETDLAARRPGADVRAILFNCSGVQMSPNARRNLAAWVEGGGHLFTTDWGVENVCAACFPGFISPLREGRKRVMTNDETVTFEADLGHPYLKGVPESFAPPVWWLEDSSYPVVVDDPERVEVLVRSKELGQRWKSDVIAVTFQYGAGRVIHVMGHLYQREGNLRGAVAMQRLLLNFLHAAVRGR